MTMFQWLQGDPLANTDLRWPGMSQDDCPVIIDGPPIQVVDRPGSGYGDYVGGAFSGTFQPRGPTDAVVVRGLPEVGEVFYRPTLGPDSSGQPSGQTGNVVTPSPDADRIPYRIVEPFRSGTAERAFDGGDVQAPGRAVSYAGDVGLVVQRIVRDGGQAPISGGSFCAEQAGQAPPTMSAEMASLEALGIERNGVPLAAGAAIFPGELITLFAQLGGLIGGDTVRFTIFDSTGAVAFGPVEQRKNLFSNRVELSIVGPTGIGFYTLEGAELIPFFPDNKLTFPFAVSATAPPPPTKPPGGGGFLGDLKGIIIAVGVVAAIVIVGPTLTRAIPRRD